MSLISNLTFPVLIQSVHTTQTLWMISIQRFNVTDASGKPYRKFVIIPIHRLRSLSLLLILNTFRAENKTRCKLERGRI